MNSLKQGEKYMHKLLSRQLIKNCLDYDSMPSDIKDWQALLNKINNTYNEADQDRYRLERSMEISSKEVVKLNNRLTYAQTIASMGYWVYDVTTQKIYWSNSAVEILGTDFTNNNQSYKSFIEALPEISRKDASAKFDAAINSEEIVEFEINFLKTNFNKWMHFMLCSSGDTLTGIVMDITKRKSYEKKVEELNKQIILSARHVGRADIAASVLHNIGNMLNSVMTSADIISENTANECIERFEMVCNLIKSNSKNIGDFLENDEKGKLLPGYLMMLKDEMKIQHAHLEQESLELKKTLSHIKSIINSQQGIAKTASVITSVNLNNLIVSSIKITGINFANHKIEISNICNVNEEIVTDEPKLTQIIVNLIINASDAIKMRYEDEHIHEGGKISITSDTISKNNNDYIEIIISDNGIGISPDVIKKLFTFGYTSKANGHGFGLHSSMLSAKEINGDIMVKSPGHNKGTTFTIMLNLEQK